MMTYNTFIFDLASGTSILYASEKVDVSDDVLDQLSNVMQTVRREDRKRASAAATTSSKPAATSSSKPASTSSKSGNSGLKPDPIDTKSGASGSKSESKGLKPGAEIKKP